MTRKDYVLIVTALRSARTAYLPVTDRETATQVETTVLVALMDALQSDNPAFDRERFYQAVTR